jgi:hypothetical protein
VYGWKTKRDRYVVDAAKLATATVYVLVAIVRKRLELEASLSQILQVLSLTQFEKTPILRALQRIDCQDDLYNSGNQLNLFSL